MEGFLAAVVAGQKVAVDRIDDLNASDAAQAGFDSFKQGMQDRLELFERAESAGGAAAIERAVRSMQAEAEVVTRRLQTAARGLGVEGCT